MIFRQGSEDHKPTTTLFALSKPRLVQKTGWRIINALTKFLFLFLEIKLKGNLVYGKKTCHPIWTTGEPEQLTSSQLTNLTNRKQRKQHNYEATSELWRQENRSGKTQVNQPMIGIDCSLIAFRVYANERE